MSIFRILFAIVATLVLLGINFYVYRRFLCKIEMFKNHTKLIKWSIIIISLCELLFFFKLRSGDMDISLYLLFSSFIGISFMLFCISLVYDLFHIPLSKVPFDKSRRLMLKTILDVTMLILAFSYMLRGFINGFKKPIIKEVEVKIKGLKKELNIVQISDVHIGKSLGKEFFDSIVKPINTLDADIVVITGDLVDLHVSQIGDKLESLKDIKARYGVYFVSGNHEYFHGVEAICEHLKSLHVKVLENESLVINNQINLAGITDLMGRRLDLLQPDLQKALLQVNPDLPTVLLAHQPKITKELKNEKIDLILSGHTHGGQIFPFGLLVLLDQPYLAGLYQHSEKTQIFVNAGAGYWGPPIRILAPSEIVKLKLVSF
ncbi:metallophosphoesterase [Sulfurospirillum arcachonense]|uniref:metallophosphoesterase n=1 Tax=Sulfurospirillum arcachonense TaxID=57666 RepID=UPI0004683D21|nr:metallophosphoesterase [Sulfurospirillum arcachonense]